jgi:AcrR family transcriptional regulator
MTLDAAPPKRRLRLTGAERRELILDAAAELFAARGFHETSVGEIAAASGISKIVLYDHFASKEELFLELTRAARDGLLARGRAQMQADGPLEQRLRGAVEAFFGYVEEEPARARLLLLLPKGEPELRDLVASIQEEATAGLVAILATEAGLLRGEPDRAERLLLMAQFIKSGLHGLAEWWAGHPTIPRERLVACAMDVAWAGLKSYYRS